MPVACGGRLAEGKMGCGGSFFLQMMWFPFFSPQACEYEQWRLGVCGIVVMLQLDSLREDRDDVLYSLDHENSNTCMIFFIFG